MALTARWWESSAFRRDIRVAFFSALLLAAYPAIRLLGSPGSQATGHARAEISFSPESSATPVDGRVYLLLSTDGTEEPRFQVREEEAQSQQIFGVDVNALTPGSSAAITDNTLGYPTRSLREIPAGDYYVQAVFSRYTTFERSDGHRVKLPMDEGEGQHWNSKPGNFYSKPQRMHLDPASPDAIRIQLTEKIPEIEPVRDTEWVKHVRIQSQLLTKFWGHPMFLGGIVVLPQGWDTHPNAHYPLLVNQGHFPRDFSGFRTDPPGADLTGYPRERTDAMYQFYQDWSTGKLPHMLILLIQHANPYYDDSYAVNSENVGPYGDAINQELIPYIEKQFRGIGQGWARGVFGGSTGGWETLATQVFYPDNFNGAWAFCPDPVDFHAYQAVNIYDDKNAFWKEGPFGRVPIPDMRGPDGLPVAMMEGDDRWELVLGTHSRSGEQFGIWQAVFSPVGDDGYPKPIWDPETGVIDHQVAAYWREHYDLTAILQRDWATLGPKLNGKIHISVGTRDTWYLDNAVRLLQKALEATSNPHYAGDFDYGPDQPHCYTGVPTLSAREGSLTATRRVMNAAADWMEKTAPAGADKSWRY